MKGCTSTFLMSAMALMGDEKVGNETKKKKRKRMRLRLRRRKSLRDVGGGRGERVR